MTIRPFRFLYLVFLTGLGYQLAGLLGVFLVFAASFDVEVKKIK